MLTAWLGDGLMAGVMADGVIVHSRLASALASALMLTMSRMCFLMAAQKCGSGSTSNGCSICTPMFSTCAKHERPEMHVPLFMTMILALAQQLDHLQAVGLRAA